MSQHEVEVPIYTYDNRYGNQATVINDKQYKILEPFAHQSLKELQEKNKNLLVFPDKSENELGDSPLYTLTQSNSDYNFNTYNIVGVYRVLNENYGSMKVEVRSRFDNINSQPFLTYLLTKVFGGYFLDRKVDITTDGMWDLLLIMLFPYYLLRAFRQGLFKQYKRFKYNNSNFKGTIGVSDFINHNIPFQGDISYQVREITYDNAVLHLIRHTIAYIRSNHSWLLGINDFEFRKACQAVENHTPSWHPQGVHEVIRNNQNSIKHPFFSEYEPLRKLCLQILYRKGVSIYGQVSETEVEGVVFDCAWLWEKYLARLLKRLNYTHHGFHLQNSGIKVFVNSRYRLYPDFLNEDKKSVLDAKYKKPDNSLSREDIHQILSYMYLTDSKFGGLIYPLPDNDAYKIKSYSIINKDSLLFKIFFLVPTQSIDKKLFLKNMEKSENDFIKMLEKC